MILTAKEKELLLSRADSRDITSFKKNIKKGTKDEEYYASKIKSKIKHNPRYDNVTLIPWGNVNVGHVVYSEKDVKAVCHPDYLMVIKPKVGVIISIALGIQATERDKYRLKAWKINHFIKNSLPQVSINSEIFGKKLFKPIYNILFIRNPKTKEEEYCYLTEPVLRDIGKGKVHYYYKSPDTPEGKAHYTFSYKDVKWKKFKIT